jgi:hypothetical protein
VLKSDQSISSHAEIQNLWSFYAGAPHNFISCSLTQVLILDIKYRL